MALQRRRLLALLAGSAAVAGCQRSTDDPEGDPATSPTGTTTATPAGADAAGCPPYERAAPDRVVCSTEPPAGALTFAPDRQAAELPTATVDVRLENTTDGAFATNFYNTRLHKHEAGEWQFLGPYTVPQPLHNLQSGATHVRRFHVDNTDLERVTFPSVRDPDADSSWTTSRHGLGPGTYALGIQSDSEGPETMYAAAFTLRGEPPGLVAPETVTGTEREDDHVTVTIDPRHEETERHDLTLTRVSSADREAPTLIDEQLYHPRFLGLRAALASVGDADSVTVRGDDSGFTRNLTSGGGARTFVHDGQAYEVRLGGPPEDTDRSLDLSGGWRQFAADARNTGHGEVTGPGGTRPAEAWRFEAPGRLYDAPTVAGDLVLVPSTDGNLYAVTAADGAEVWRFAVRGQCRTTPAVADGTVYVAGRDGGVYALDAATGEQRWTFTGGEGFAISHPTVAGETVYIGDGAGTLFALDAADGMARWSYAAGDDIATSPAVADGTVYIGWRSLDRPESTSGPGGLDAVSTDGTREWRVRPGNVDGSPTVADGTVYAGSEAGLVAVDAATGERRWTFERDPMSGSPAVADGTVYVGTHEGNLHALDPATGESRWFVHTDKWCDYATATADDTVYHTSWDAHVYAVAPDGTLRWKHPFETPLSAPAVADGAVYVASNRSLVALRPE
jgi:hypothetical protein